MRAPPPWRLKQGIHPYRLQPDRPDPTGRIKSRAEISAASPGSAVRYLIIVSVYEALRHVLPRVDHLDSGRPEGAFIARRHGEAVHMSDGGDQSIGQGQRLPPAYQVRMCASSLEIEAQLPLPEQSLEQIIKLGLQCLLQTVTVARVLSPILSDINDVNHYN